MEEPSVGCVSHTSAAEHEGLLSQCSVTHSPANTRKVEANVVIAMQNQKEPYKGIYIVSTA